MKCYITLLNGAIMVLLLLFLAPTLNSSYSCYSSFSTCSAISHSLLSIALLRANINLSDVVAFVFGLDDSSLEVSRSFLPEGEEVNVDSSSLDSPSSFITSLDNGII